MSYGGPQATGAWRKVGSLFRLGLVCCGAGALAGNDSRQRGCRITPATGVVVVIGNLKNLFRGAPLHSA
ncbi:MAG: hypothetical protein ACI91J_002727 [Yoonia sp.]|jgi:hypothetical protein